MEINALYAVAKSGSSRVTFKQLDRLSASEAQAEKPGAAEPQGSSVGVHNNLAAVLWTGGITGRLFTHG